MRIAHTLPVVVTLSLAACAALAQPCAPAWSAPAPGGADGEILAMLSFDDGSGPALYAAGEFDSIDGVTASNIARWDGVAWEQVGGGLQNDFGRAVRALAVYNAGDGPRLFAAGDFDLVDGSALAWWDGQSWNDVESSPFSWIGSIRASSVAGASELYVSGPASEYVLRWDGDQWRTVGAGLDSVAWDFEHFDDGSGEALYAAGIFASLEKFDGAQWTSIGGAFSFTGQILDLQAFDDGRGEALFVAGEFTRAPGFLDCLYIARWDGAAWEQVGDGFDAPARALAVFDDGSGPALYAAGDFTHSGAAPLAHVARWDAAAWTPVAGGLDAPADSLATFTTGDGRTSLVATGVFTTAGAAGAPNVAALASCVCPADLAKPAGVLDFSDVTAFLAAFTAADPAADLAEPVGVFDFSDVVAFLAAFAAGCP